VSDEIEEFECKLFTPDQIARVWWVKVDFFPLWSDRPFLDFAQKPKIQSECALIKGDQLCFNPDVDLNSEESR
jgi:hypothetical protein